jgi:hypothetical protein
VFAVTVFDLIVPLLIQLIDKKKPKRDKKVIYMFHMDDLLSLFKFYVCGTLLPPGT